MKRDFLTDPLLEEQGIPHGFGLRGCVGPAALCRPVQVHGVEIAQADGRGDSPLGEADGVVTTTPGIVVGVVTADCVPILLADPASGAVAAVHAGWRGLAAGVVARGVAALAAQGAQASRLTVAIGPHIGAECYEVDEPVIEGLRRRFGSETGLAVTETRSGHASLALGALVAADLRRAGVPAASIGVDAAACTRCDEERFHSYRRDGARAGRLVHWIESPARDREERR